MAEPATLGKSGKKLADSAVKLEVSTGRIEDSADRRTELAADRTLFAAERTYNAWVRTGPVSVAKNPMRREPVTLISSVPQGNVSPISRATRPDSQYRPVVPSAPRLPPRYSFASKS
jgi:hypothetical protein